MAKLRIRDSESIGSVLLTDHTALNYSIFLDKIEVELLLPGDFQKQKTNNKQHNKIVQTGVTMTNIFF